MERPKHCQSILLRFLLLSCDLIFRKGHGEVKTQVTLERKEYNYGKSYFILFFETKSVISRLIKKQQLYSTFQVRMIRFKGLRGEILSSFFIIFLFSDILFNHIQIFILLIILLSLQKS